MLQLNKITISQRIELVANNKAITYFRKGFGCARLAYNWGLAKHKEYYEQGIKKSAFDLKKEFNSIKKTEFPFVYEITKYATQQPFINLGKAFQKFFADLKKGKVSYPRFKKKSNSSGSFYIGGDQVQIQNEKYLKIPNLGLVKMREPIKYVGKINNATISQVANKFYVSFSMEITQEEYDRTHKPAIYKNLGLGIDIGLKSFAVLSNGLEVLAPKPLAKTARKIKKLQRQLSRKQHPKTKGDTTKKSRNYLKASLKLAKAHRKIANIRQDFLHKLTSSLVRNVDYFCLEDLNVQGMMKNHRLAKSISDVSFFEFRRMLEYKASYLNKVIVKVDRFYPSSKTCSHCGHIKTDLTLQDRVYICEKCNHSIDRDFNASLNLYSQIKEKIGGVPTEWTPVDLTALQSDLAINRLATSKVSQKWIENEAGIQLKLSS